MLGPAQTVNQPLKNIRGDGEESSRHKWLWNITRGDVGVHCTQEQNRIIIFRKKQRLTGPSLSVVGRFCLGEIFLEHLVLPPFQYFPSSCPNSYKAELE